MAPPTAKNANNQTSYGVLKTNSLPRSAYVTFLAGNGDYWKGVVGVSGKHSRCTRSWWLSCQTYRCTTETCCCPKGVSFERLNRCTRRKTRVGSSCRTTSLITPSSVCGSLWNTMVFDNIDHLFDLPDGFFYAVMDCFCEKSWSHTNQYKVGYCQQSPKKVQWPEKELGPKPPPYFNAGV
ncbi:putative inositol 3-alpha-galactosyltransferase [Helianthus anomalus]